MSDTKLTPDQGGTPKPSQPQPPETESLTEQMGGQSQPPQAEPQRQQGAEPEAEVSLEGDLEQLRAELQDANQRLLRAQADLENYRKRVRREMEDERRYAILPILRDLLPVVDNLQRAIEAAEQGNQEAGLLAGVQMVQTQLTSVLQQHQCQRIEAVGKPFDPNLHEAIAQEPSQEHPAGTVTRVTLPGYQLHQRVVRPPQVLVSTGHPQASQPSNQEAEP